MFENFEVPTDLIPSDPRFASGPSLIPSEFVSKLLETGPHYLGTSHRKSAFTNLVKEVKEGLSQYFNTPDDYEVVFGNGGATFFFDACGIGLVEKKSAHFTCGEFSTKWYKSHDLVPWIETHQIAVDFGQGITPAPITDCDMVCTTLNETSTGVIVDTFAKLDGYEGLIAVDATSGGGQVPCDLSKVDVFFFSPQKVFASEGGLWVAIMSPKAIERAMQLADDKQRYIPPIMNLKLAIENSRKNSTYTTPSMTSFFFLNEQLKLMNKVGYDQVIEQAKKKAELVYSWAESKDYLQPFIQEPRYRSMAVATINVDEKYPVDGLVKKLRDDKVVYDIDAYRKLGKNQFRIALFHNIKIEDLEKLTKLLSLAIESA